MLILMLALVSIGVNPPDASKAATKALRDRDYRLAGVSTFWGSMHGQKADWQPYGLKCRPLPVSAYAYGYFVSDAITHEAFDGYKKQRRFLIAFNAAMLRSGKLPKEWGCVKDANPRPFS